MKISEQIKLLQDIKAIHGDIETVAYSITGRKAFVERIIYEGTYTKKSLSKQALITTGTESSF